MLRIVTVKFPEELLTALDKYCSRAGLDRSVVLRLAVYKYLRNNAPELLEEVDEKVDRSVEVIGDEA